MKKDRDKNEIQIIAPPHPRPTLTIDWDYYLTFLEDSDASEAEKRELIETLWSIVVSFVDLGFGIHPFSKPCPMIVNNYRI